ncbi:hypothetical protein F4811DRAFT_503410 [Daldinia bambusicola]|nr:hypothetical protein F4811DRAFT_503410 [Daldinia bambusicola]
MHLSPTLLSTHSGLIQKDTKCRANGNADIYGIGIRIGLYMQTIGSSISLTLERKVKLANAYSLHIALLVAIVYNSIQRPITPAEVVIALDLLNMPQGFELYTALRDFFGKIPYLPI